jgi:hypothetical protein
MVHTVAMRRLVVPVITLALVLIPTMASALCITEPFDQVVRGSDAVLVGTIVSARSLTHRIGPDTWRGGGILVRINVEDVLKGSAEDSDRFILGSCAPPVGGPGAQHIARKVIGSRGLFLITVPADGHPSSEPNEAMTPQGSVDDRIARAREVLGLDKPWIDTVFSSPTRAAIVAAGIAGAAVLVVIGFLVARRRRSDAEGA